MLYPQLNYTGHSKLVKIGGERGIRTLDKAFDPILP